MASIGRDDDERYTKPEAHGVDLGRISIVVAASPVVPGDEDRDRVPKGLAPIQGDRGEPVRPFSGESLTGVVGETEGGTIKVVWTRLPAWISVRT